MTTQEKTIKIIIVVNVIKVFGTLTVQQQIQSLIR